MTSCPQVEGRSEAEIDRLGGGFALDWSHFHKHGLFKKYRPKAVHQDQGCTSTKTGLRETVCFFLICTNSVQYIKVAAVESHLNVYCTFKSDTLLNSLQVDFLVWAGLNRCSANARQWCTNSSRLNRYQGSFKWRCGTWSFVVAKWSKLTAVLLYSTLDSQVMSLCGFHIGVDGPSGAICITFTPSSRHKLQHPQIFRQQTVVSMSRRPSYDMWHTWTLLGAAVVFVTSQILLHTFTLAQSDHFCQRQGAWTAQKKLKKCLCLVGRYKTS